MIRVGKDTRAVDKVYVGRALISKIYHAGRLVYTAIKRLVAIMFGNVLSSDKVFVDTLKTAATKSVDKLTATQEVPTLEDTYQLAGSEVTRTDADTNFIRPSDFFPVGPGQESDSVLLASRTAIRKNILGATTNVITLGTALTSDPIGGFEASGRIYLATTSAIMCYNKSTGAQIVRETYTLPSGATFLGLDLFQGGGIGIVHSKGIQMHTRRFERNADLDVVKDYGSSAKRAGGGFIFKNEGGFQLVDYNNEPIVSPDQASGGTIGGATNLALSKDGTNFIGLDGRFWRRYVIQYSGASNRTRVSITTTKSATANGMWLYDDDKVIAYSRADHVMDDGTLGLEYRFFEGDLSVDPPVTKFVDGNKGYQTRSRDILGFSHITVADRYVYASLNDRPKSLLKFRKGSEDFEITAGFFKERGDILFKLDNALAKVDKGGEREVVTGNGGAAYSLPGRIASLGAAENIPGTTGTVYGLRFTFPGAATSRAVKYLCAGKGNKDIILGPVSGQTDNSGLVKLDHDGNMTALCHWTAAFNPYGAVETDDKVYAVSNTSTNELRIYTKSDNSFTTHSVPPVANQSGDANGSYTLGIDRFGEYFGVIKSEKILMFNADGTRAEAQDITQTNRFTSITTTSGGFIFTRSRGSIMIISDYRGGILSRITTYIRTDRRNTNVLTRDGTYMYHVGRFGEIVRIPVTWTGTALSNVQTVTDPSIINIYATDLNPQPTLNFNFDTPAGVDGDMKSDDFYKHGYFFKNTGSDYKVFRHDYDADGAANTPQSFTHDIAHLSASGGETPISPYASNDLSKYYNINPSTLAIEERALTKTALVFPVPALAGTTATTTAPDTAGIILFRFAGAIAQGFPSGPAQDSSSVLAITGRGVGKVNAAGTATPILSIAANVWRDTLHGALELDDTVVVYVGNRLTVYNKISATAQTNSDIVNSGAVTLPSGATFLGLDQFGDKIGVVHTKGVTVFNSDLTRASDADITRSYTNATTAGGGFVAGGSSSNGSFFITDYQGNSLFAPFSPFFSPFLDVRAVSRDGTTVYGQDSGGVWRKATLTWTG